MPISPRCCSVLIVTCVVQTYIICLGPRKAIFIFSGINTALACKHFNFSSIGLCVNKGCWELTRMLLCGVWKVGKKAEFRFFVNRTIHFFHFLLSVISWRFLRISSNAEGNGTEVWGDPWSHLMGDQGGGLFFLLLWHIITNMVI